MTGTDLRLPSDLAVAQYKALRTDFRKDDSSAQGRIRATERSLQTMWEQYTAPYRVVRHTEYGDEVHPHYVIYRVEGHGLEQEVWHLRGEHRELDAVRLSVMLRNEMVQAQQEALEEGDINWSLRHCRQQVLALKGGSSQQQDPIKRESEWQQKFMFTEDYQTLEYALEFGGEGERVAILRTYLRGRPRYWSFSNGVFLGEQMTGGSMDFLGTDTEAALRACPYPWAALVGLAVAPDLVPVVQKILAEHGKTLDDWMMYFESDKTDQWTCKYVWWDCDAFTEQPVDAFWMTARPEVMRRFLGGLSDLQIAGMRVDPGASVGVLIDQWGRVLSANSSDYPESNMWASIPFSEVPEIQVQTIAELRGVLPFRPQE